MNEQYDVAIIGAGIGGLVCGCYLAKAGLKVVIVEQHNKPGGYCTSFERQGYRFDVGVHYLGGVRSGSLKKIFEELNLNEHLKFFQFDPTDKIIMPDNILYIRAQINDTIRGFQKEFPQEKANIKKFFDLILNKDFLSVYSKIRRLSFVCVLDSYFRSQKLKSTLEVLMGNVGAPAEKISAISAALLFREFLSDPGWYPEGGVQAFPETLVGILKYFKGQIFFNKKVEKIIIEDYEARGIILEDGFKIRAKIVVSNADLTQTFKKLVDIKSKERISVDALEISPSIFSVFIGLKEGAINRIKEPATIWLTSTYNIRECYSNVNKSSDFSDPVKILICTFPFLHENNSSNKPTMELFIPAPFKTEDFWEKNRQNLMDKLIERAEKIFPNLVDYTNIKFNATPYTHYRYTLNRDGAAYGWISVPELVNRPLFLGKSSIKNLFISGHWCNGGLSQGSISQVSVSGRTTARYIFENLGMQWAYKHSVL